MRNCFSQIRQIAPQAWDLAGCKC
ncbi:protein of unknown function [Cyanobium sp. NIES-981]|nr:protein of unknown function [Cyanobium sp. NIES-981]